MGLTYADLKIKNLFNKRSLQISALVDSGSIFLNLPEHMATQLGFDTTEVGTREVVLAHADKRAHRAVVPMIGPLRVWFGERYCDLSALVLGDEPLLGAVPMEMMDLVLSPLPKT
jgi:predicted aspartyl protease